ncbi:MAG: glycosyltransferase family 9 protein, partial [Deltaproteobacteria bacterium]|nr:glycosyltransferase family 9 protein [Deltaproteobacteria bacterium]
MFIPKKILAIKFRSLGDTVLLSASLEALHKTFPQAEIQVAALSDYIPVLEHIPYIKKIRPFSFHKNKIIRLKRILQLANSMKNEKFDTAVSFHASPSSAFLAFLCGAKNRSIHIHDSSRKHFFSTVHIPDQQSTKSILERDLDAIRAFGVNIKSAFAPKIILLDTEKQKAKELLNNLHLSMPLLGLGLGSSRPTKSWHLERFALLSVQWCQKTQGSVIAFLSKDEEPLSFVFLKKIEDIIQTFVTTPAERAKIRSQIHCKVGISIRSLAAILSQCSLFLGNDSGPRHIAAAVGTPTVTLFGPEHPFEWHPY